MAQLKQLSAGSSQIIMMMFRDKNNAPIKADSVHVKGSIFTGSGKPFEFEVNKGVCTNCKIQNENTWDFIPWYKTIDSSLTTSDEQGNIVLQTKNLRFKKPFFIA